MLPRRAAVVPIGAPGAGKTTVLTAMAQALGEPGFRHGPDDVRRVAFGTVAYQGAGHLVHQAAQAIFAARLSSGRAAAYDATNTLRKERGELLELVRPYRVAPVALVLRVDDDELLRRNRSRPPEAVVPDDLVVKFNKRVTQLDADQLRADGFQLVVELPGGVLGGPVSIEPRPNRRLRTPSSPPSSSSSPPSSS